MSTSKKKKPVMHVSQGHLAQEAVHSIVLLSKKLGLDEKTSKRNKRLLVGTSHVPTSLVEEVAGAAGRYGTKIGMHFDADAAREALGYIASFELVAAEADAFATRVREAILAKKADVGRKSLAVYTTMKGIAKSGPEGAFAIEPVARMTKMMKRGRRAAPAAASAPAPVAAPSTPPPALAAVPKAADKPVGATIVVQVPQDTKAA